MEDSASDLGWEVVSHAGSETSTWEVLSEASAATQRPSYADMARAAKAPSARGTAEWSYGMRARAAVPVFAPKPAAGKENGGESEGEEDEAALCPVKHCQPEGGRGLRAHGHTMRSRCPCCQPTGAGETVTLSKRADKASAPLVSTLDTDLGFAVTHSIRIKDEASAAAVQSAVASAISTSTPKSRLRRHDADKTTVEFKMEPVGMLVASKKQAQRPIGMRDSDHQAMKKRLERVQTTLFRLNRNGVPEPVCLRQMPPSPDIKFPRLAAQLFSHIPTANNTHTKSARTDCHGHRSAWVPNGPARRCYLEADLGGQCEVMQISTRPRYPKTYEWPSKEERKETGELAHTVIESERVECVPQFELSVREEGGSTWDVVGIFHGSTDLTTELVHSLTPYAAPGHSGVMCRYIRFKPLPTNTPLALRVGIFGHGKQAAAAASKAQTKKAEEDEDAGVTYTVETVKARHPKHSERSVGYRDWGRKGNRRQKLKEETRSAMI